VARKILSDADGQTFTNTMHLYPTFDLTHAPTSMENAGKHVSHRTTKVVCIVQVSIEQVDPPSHIMASTYLANTFTSASLCLRFSTTISALALMLWIGCRDVDVAPTWRK
jgi:hypothetical protein